MDDLAGNLSGDLYSVETDEGRSVYITACPEPEPAFHSFRKLQSQSSLIEQPVEQLIREIEEELFEKAVKQVGNQHRLPEASPLAGEVDDAELWVEKYKPKGFVELLSNETVNRDLVKWVKSWDACVFGRNGKAADEDSKPQHKIVLLCGPPGICAAQAALTFAVDLPFW